ncbi:DUF4982 domain-containing protein, partial [Candidatus Bathyarchaeota archaeon]|nr:DUF4982 domain-containing protein [Candidatus Bathyarchaeota archaeon]
MHVESRCSHWIIDGWSYIALYILPGNDRMMTMSRITRELREGWMFHRGDVEGGEAPGFNDEKWQEVSVPHDWSIEGPFKQFRMENWSSFQNLDHRIGYLPQGIGWYRLEFKMLKEWEGKVIRLEFGGIYRESTIWVNGKRVGFRPYGYATFCYDITDAVIPGRNNIIAIRVDNTGVSSRWYAGSGIYRKVQVTVLNRVHVAWHGTCITTPHISPSRGTVRVKTRVENMDSLARNTILEHQIRGNGLAGDDVPAMMRESTLKPGNHEIVLEGEVPDPHMWDITHPNLYNLVTRIKDGRTDELLDEYLTTFGFRWFRFDPDEGFFLNGTNVKFKGVCLHHDNGPLGARAHPRAIERKITILKGMGCNAIRTSHNPPSRAFLDACDRMGMLVIDELFDEWTIMKTPRGYWNWFNEPVSPSGDIKWYQRDCMDFIHRDRNHPCVIMWSCGNEVPEQHERYGEKGIQVLERLLEIFHREDPTRPVTQGCNQMEQANETGFAARLDVVGYNYSGDRPVTVGEHAPLKVQYDLEHEKYPDRAMIGTENCSAFSSRGIYEYPIGFTRHGKMRPNFQVSSHDVTSEIPLIVLNTRKYVCGYFSWTGFDYLGEPTPYRWPARSSYFGIVDLCGFPKDGYFLHKSMWTAEPMVHLVPSSWNFHEGQHVEVWAYSNCESVELFLNGKSLGTRKMHEFDDLAHVFWDVAFQPGELRAVARTSGKEIAVHAITTAGPIHHLSIEPDRACINADGYDIVYLTVSARDATGILVPRAQDLVTFSVEGPGKIIAVGNGNPISHEPFNDQQRHLFSGKALGILQSKGK